MPLSACTILVFPTPENPMIRMALLVVRIRSRIGLMESSMLSLCPVSVTVIPGAEIKVSTTP